MKQKIFLSIIVLALASLSCSIFVGGPDYPANPIPYSEEELKSMDEIIEEAYTSGAETGLVTFQITESQLTSFMIAEFNAMESPPFNEPQVLLRNGQMQVYGKTTAGVFDANIMIAINLGVDPVTGLPTVSVASADFGPLPTPEGLNNAISAIVEEAFTGSFGPVATGFRLEKIEIADGVMTLSGRIK